MVFKYGGPLAAPYNINKITEKIYQRPSVSSEIHLVQTQLDVANARIARLSEENELLRHKLGEQHTNAAVNIEARMKAFKLEDDYERLLDHLQQVKKNYNKLHDAYLEKVKRCKALEDMFQRQKTLSGLVMKSAIEQRVQEQKLILDKRMSEDLESTQREQLELQVSKLQTALDEAYDIIDELEFELESVDLLEMQNQTLQSELTALKANKIHTISEKDNDNEPTDIRQMISDCDCDDHFLVDDKLDRNALTESLIQTAEAESNCLRRELLRSRLQNTFRAKQTNQK